MPDKLTLTEKEQFKLIIINKAITHEITNLQAAKKLQLSLRQVKRLKQQIKLQGDMAIIHKLKGKQSNHHISVSLKTKAIEIIRSSYTDFKPILAAEKLEELHGITLTAQTVRIWMTEAGIWKPRRKKKNGEYRSWRPRKEYFGEMEQFDGSYHFWFEDRFVDEQGDPIEVCLLASIDDAKGEITKAVFAANEGVKAVFTFCKEYVEKLGKPKHIYLDKFSTYKINHKNAVDNKDLMTQFQRAMRDLGINPIPANSPQAKGRIERLFDTLQDRLVKEMRLAKINTPDAGNKFLKEYFIPRFNKKFGVVPAKTGDVHEPLSQTNKKNLSRIFSVQSTRIINNDFTIQFKNNCYQLKEIQKITVRAKERVLVEEWLDGTIHLSIRGEYLNYIVLPEKPKKQNKNPIILTTHKLNYKPPQNHPWRKSYKSKR